MAEEVVGRGSMPEDGWASTGRVARDAGLGVVSLAGIAAAGSEFGLLPQDVISTHPQTFMLLTAVAPVVWRFIIKLFGRQRKAK